MKSDERSLLGGSLSGSGTGAGSSATRRGRRSSAGRRPSVRSKVVDDEEDAAEDGGDWYVSESWYRQAKDMYRYCSSECVLVLSVPCILTVLGIAIVIEHVSRKRYNCPPAKSSRCKI